MTFTNPLSSVDTISIIGTLVTTFSFVFAVWWYRQSRRIKKLISFEAIALHNNISVALGATQEAKTAIVTGQSASPAIGRAEGLCQAVLNESAKLYCNIKGTRLDDIDDLISNGQLKSTYKDIYYSFSDKRRGNIRKFIKLLRGKI